MPFTACQITGLPQRQGDSTTGGRPHTQLSILIVQARLAERWTVQRPCACNRRAICRPSTALHRPQVGFKVGEHQYQKLNVRLTPRVRMTRARMVAEKSIVVSKSGSCDSCASPPSAANAAPADNKGSRIAAAAPAE